MNRTNWIVVAFLLLLVPAGIYIGTFWGGMLVGFATSMLLLQFIGRRIAAKAAHKIDKNVRDIVIYEKE